MCNDALALSLKGSERDNNQDFSINGKRKDDKELWIIADGATCAENSGSFVSEFCSRFLETWLTRKPLVDIVDIFPLLKEIHEQIRRDFILSKGCVLLLIVDPQNEEQHCFYLGDCRLGAVYESDTFSNINWVTYPHSLTYTEVGANEETLCKAPNRHVLFNILNARRFKQPTHTILRLDLKKPIILATDGFWSIFPARLPRNLTQYEISKYFDETPWTDDCSVLIRIPNV